MAALWGIVDRFIPGPAGMLVLQGTAFVAGVYLILCRAMRPQRAAIWTSVVVLFPPVLAPLAVIWKDCLMAGFLVLGVPAVLAESRRRRIIGLGLFVMATAMRYNALAATFPLVMLLFEWERGKRWFVRYAIAAGAWLVVVLVAFTLNALLVDRNMHYWQSSSALVDITGVLAKLDRDIPDAELRPLLAPTEIRVDTNIHAAVRAKYKAYDFQQLIAGDGKLWEVSLYAPFAEARRDAVTHAWRTLVLGNLGAYARYRLDTFSETIGLRRKYHGIAVVLHKAQYPGMLDYMGIGRGTSALQENWEELTSAARKTKLFRPYAYLFLSLLLLGFCRGHRDVFALLLSGIAMELTLFLLSWTPDFRFSHWLVTCTCVATIMLIARRRGGAP
jgi:hypothetical protein